MADKLKSVLARGHRDVQCLPRVAVSFGHGGTPAHYMGSFAAFLSAFGPVDFSFGSGQGVKCMHSEHLFGEYWHRAFTVSADTPYTDYNLSLGANNEVTGGVSAVARHAAARLRGARRVQVEPHLSITAAASAEWIPIKPKTDAAFMFALIHVLLHEHPRPRLDIPFLAAMTSSPYLVGPQGYFLRDPASRKPLLWDMRVQAAVPFDGTRDWRMSTPAASRRPGPPPLLLAPADRRTVTRAILLVWFVSLAVRLVHLRTLAPILLRQRSRLRPECPPEHLAALVARAST